jgi:hypothetical protein
MDNEQKKTFTFCAACGCRLTDSYYTFTDNSLNGTVFFELDGSDNVFCSKNCACSMLRLLKRAN